MLFLIDENLPASVGETFKERGHSVELVKQLRQLRGQPDEVVFNYAADKKAILVTRDLGFANPFRFELKTLGGIIILRFPNEMSIRTLVSEVKRLTESFTEPDYKKLIVIEPGSIRSRKL